VLDLERAIDPDPAPAIGLADVVQLDLDFVLVPRADTGAKLTSW
jgi:hypothetical protein